MKSMSKFMENKRATIAQKSRRRFERWKYIVGLTLTFLTVLARLMLIINKGNEGPGTTAVKLMVETYSGPLMLALLKSLLLGSALFRAATVE